MVRNERGCILRVGGHCGQRSAVDYCLYLAHQGPEVVFPDSLLGQNGGQYLSNRSNLSLPYSPEVKRSRRVKDPLYPCLEQFRQSVPRSIP